MSTVLFVLVFMAGIHLSIVTLATAYRIIDLWYTIGDYWLGILGRIALLALINGLLMHFLPFDLKKALLYGELFYVAMHISNYFFGRLLIWVLGRRS